MNRHREMRTAVFAFVSGTYIDTLSKGASVSTHWLPSALYRDPLNDVK